MIVRHGLLYKMKISFCKIIWMWWGSQTSHPYRAKKDPLFAKRVQSRQSKLELYYCRHYRWLESSN